MRLPHRRLLAAHGDHARGEFAMVVRDPAPHGILGLLQHLASVVEAQLVAYTVLRSSWPTQARWHVTPGLIKTLWKHME